MRKAKKIRPETLGGRKAERYPYTGKVMNRPVIRYPIVVLHIVLALAVDALVCLFLLVGVSHFSWYDSIRFSLVKQFWLLYGGLLLLYALVRMRSILIFCVRLYQRYAPFDIRCGCVYIPNCSEYMILALKKYGAIRGLYKGIKRLLRCHDPNGGYDYP